MTLPPRTLPSPLASFGRANSEYSEIDAFTGLPSLILNILMRATAPRLRLSGAGSWQRTQAPVVRRDHREAARRTRGIAVRCRGDRGNGGSDWTRGPRLCGWG